MQRTEGERSSRILVVDDERVIRRLLCEMLVHAGHETIEARSAEEALRVLDVEEVDLLVTDLVLPARSGLELLDEIRASRPSLPVVIVTGSGTYDNVSRALAGGASAVLAKPFSHAELCDAVAAALGAHGSGNVRAWTPTPPASSETLSNARESSP